VCHCSNLHSTTAYAHSKFGGLDLSVHAGDNVHPWETEGAVSDSTAVIWLERLANRCKLHGYAEQAALLRAKADRLNASLPPSARVAPDDERCREPVPGGLAAFIRQAKEALDDV
jgi:hypothetical protein